MTTSSDIWSIKTALDWTVGYLERKGDENPRLSAEWLLSEATGLRRIELYVNFEKPLSMDERDVLRDYVRRRGAGEPLQYITGEVGFRHITVKVRQGVLIPRPETEVLVSEALALLPAPAKRYAAEFLHESDSALDDEIGRGAGALSGCDLAQKKFELLVADLCTGSGCIACSMAYEHPDVRVVATDIASEAVSLAKENVEILGLRDRVGVLECDLGQGIDSDLIGRFDVIVSNPPYVPTAVMADIPNEVAAFEPALALDGGEDGLDVFRRLLSFCEEALKPGGGFAFELHETCLDQAVREALEAGFVNVRVVNDLAQRPRVLVARKTV